MNMYRHVGGFGDVLSGVGAVVHEEKLNVPGVVDDESLVARGHHVLGLLVASVSDLRSISTVPTMLSSFVLV